MIDRDRPDGDDVARTPRCECSCHFPGTMIVLVHQTEPGPGSDEEFTRTCMDCGANGGCHVPVIGVRGHPHVRAHAHTRTQRKQTHVHVRTHTHTHSHTPVYAFADTNTPALSHPRARICTNVIRIATLALTRTRKHQLLTYTHPRSRTSSSHRHTYAYPHVPWTVVALASSTNCCRVESAFIIRTFTV